MFSTMITPASTRMPKSTAPSDSRLTGTWRALSKQERDRERERDRRRDDQPGPEAAQEQHQDQRHQEHAEQQVVLDRVRGERDRDRCGRSTGGSGRRAAARRSLRYLVIAWTALEHGLRRVAGAQEQHALDRVVVVHVAELAEPRRVAELDLAEVA